MVVENRLQYSLMTDNSDGERASTSPEAVARKRRFMSKLFIISPVTATVPSWRNSGLSEFLRNPIILRQQLLRHSPPHLIGIELGYCLRCLFCCLAEVLLVKHPVLIDHEGHDARVSVLCRVGEDCKSSCHLAINDIVFAPPFASGPCLSSISK